MVAVVRALALGGAVALCAAACTDPDTPRELVVGTRLLAVRAEPPQPRDEAAVIFRALYDVQGAASWQWTLCACPREGAEASPASCLSEAWTCAFSVEEVATLTAASTASCTPLWEVAGVEPPATGTPLPWAALADACLRAGGSLGAGDPATGPWRFGIRVDLVAQGGRVTGEYALHAGGTGPANRNPEVTGIDVLAGGAPVGTSQSIEPGEQVELRAHVDPASLDRAPSASRVGGAAQGDELTWRWFASDGAFVSAEEQGADPVAVWEAPQGLSALDLESRITWWAVVYDGRGGVAWVETSRTVAVPGSSAARPAPR